jgi:hypothetical protein
MFKASSKVICISMSFSIPLPFISLSPFLSVSLYTSSCYVYLCLSISLFPLSLSTSLIPLCLPRSLFSLCISLSLYPFPLSVFLCNSLPSLSPYILRPYMSLSVPLFLCVCVCVSSSLCPSPPLSISFAFTKSWKLTFTIDRQTLEWSYF